MKETVEGDIIQENYYNMYTIATKETLYDNQMSSYSIIRTSFMMKNLIEGNSIYEQEIIFKSILKMVTDHNYMSLGEKDIIKILKDCRAQEQLIMFLSGPAGSGESHVINACQKCSKIFCDHAYIPFDVDIFKINDCIGSKSAQLASGTTIHSAAELNRKIVTYNSSQWENFNIY